MWNSDNSFHSDGNEFQRNNGQLPHNFLQGFDSTGFIPFPAVASQQGQQFFPHHTFQQYNEGLLMGGAFQHGNAILNGNSFLNNRMMSTESTGSYISLSPQTSTEPPRSDLNAVAAGLRAKLIEGRLGRETSGTPPLTAVASKTFQPHSTILPLRESPISRHGTASPAGSHSNGYSTVSVSDSDIHDLLSEVQALTEIKERKQKVSSTKAEPKIQQPTISRTSTLSQKTLNSQLGEGKEAPSGVVERRPTNTKLDTRTHCISDTSDEGEIRDNTSPTSIPTSTAFSNPTHVTLIRESQSNTDARPKEEQVLRKRQEDDDSKTTLRPDGRPRSSQRRSRSPAYQARDSNIRPRTEVRYEDADERKDQRNRESYKVTHRTGWRPDLDERTYQRRESQDKVEDRHNQIDKIDESVSAKTNPPTLEELIAINEDLRDWLQFTGWHDVDKRNKTLNRRRALAALDAQRAKLLEEEELEGGRAISSLDSQVARAVLTAPPLAPTTTAVSVAPTRSVSGSTIKKLNQITARPRDRSGADSSVQCHTHDAKRRYSDYRDEGRDERDSRVAERESVRIKRENADHRPYSRGHGSPLNRSASPPAKSYGWDDRDKYVEGRERGRGTVRGRDWDRDLSPDSQACRIRAPARTIGSDDNMSEGRGKDQRPFVSVGGYRGRAFDPNYYKTRGRGGRAPTGPRAHPESRAVKQEKSGYTSRIADLSPYKDPKGIDGGGRGETRYFIVKSFNEENVVRCISDSIWTTQAHNGGTFSEAFERCKNVVLIFSINQSHAFQGYARMESPPGSEEAPSWLNNINWESAGAFKVRWMTIAVTKFSRVAHLKNTLNDNQAVLVAKDGQEVEERCGSELIRLIDEEYDGRGMDRRYRDP